MDVGPKIDVSSHHASRKPLPTQVPGRHLWIVSGVWRIADPESDQVYLDAENLLTLAGPGCFWCEKDYSPELASQTCKGES